MNINTSKQTNKHWISYDKCSIKDFFARNFDIMNKFMEKNNIDEKINKEITDGIIHFYENGGL